MALRTLSDELSPLQHSNREISMFMSRTVLFFSLFFSLSLSLSLRDNNWMFSLLGLSVLFLCLFFSFCYYWQCRMKIIIIRKIIIIPRMRIFLFAVQNECPLLKGRDQEKKRNCTHGRKTQANEERERYIYKKKNKNPNRNGLGVFSLSIITHVRRIVFFFLCWENHISPEKKNTKWERRNKERTSEDHMWSNLSCWIACGRVSVIVERCSPLSSSA